MLKQDYYFFSMTLKICTEIIIASLIFLGDIALASEASHHTDDAVAGGNTVQVSQSVSLDNDESKCKQVPASTNFKEEIFKLRYQTLSSIPSLVSSISRYDLFNPRAPPIPVK